MKQLNKIKTLIIAEIGVNHNGNSSTAIKMLNKLKDIGVSAVKLQYFNADLLTTPSAQKTKYQKQNSSIIENQYSMLKKLELNEKQVAKIIKYGKKIGLKVILSVFYQNGIDFIKKYKLQIIKIPSGEITNIPYLEKIGKLNKKIILSTGMSNINEIKIAINILTKFGTKKENINILHCTSEYPAPYRDVNLNAMKFLKRRLNLNIGLSDHTKGISIAIAAAALGANIIEKHFTLNKKQKGPDHESSLEPDEFKNMIKSIKNVEISLGIEQKKITHSEMKNIYLVRKSIVAVKKIKKGDIFTEENISTKRPFKGISASKWRNVIGKKAKFNFNINDFIKLK